MKKILIACASLALLMSMTSCGTTKKSEYRRAYEAAKQRELAQRESSYKPIYKAPDSAKEVKTEAVVTKERISAYEGENRNNLRRFSVVIGSFRNPTNAKSLKERMVKKGYNAVLAKNEMDMLRVIISSFDTKEEAAASRDAIKTRFAPDFQDAWLLENV